MTRYAASIVALLVVGVLVALEFIYPGYYKLMLAASAALALAYFIIFRT